MSVPLLGKKYVGRERAELREAPPAGKSLPEFYFVSDLLYACPAESLTSPLLFVAQSLPTPWE